jgi:AAA domain
MTCTRCGSRPGEPRREHAERVLCDQCAAKPPIIDWQHPPDPPDPELLKSPRLEKIDGRISAHDRRYGARRQDFANLLARAELQPPYRVKPLAVDGHLTVLAATGGDGKTWLGFAMVAGVAHGTSVAGMDCERGKAVIFDAENGPWVLGSRMKALEEGLPADRVAIYDAEGLRLSDPEDRAWMLGIIRTEQANLVIIDSLRPLAPDVAENDSDSMAPVVVGAKQLARDSGAAVVLIHHRGHDRARAFRGSTVIRDQTDVLFVLERDERDPERRWRRRLWCDKFRLGPEPEDRWLGIRGHKGYVTLTEAAPPDTPGRKATVREDVADQALAVLRSADGPMSQSAVARAIGRDKSDRTFRRAFDDLVEDRKEVIATGDGYLLAGGGTNVNATPATPHHNWRLRGWRQPPPF